MERYVNLVIRLVILVLLVLLTLVSLVSPLLITIPVRRLVKDLVKLVLTLNKTLILVNLVILLVPLVTDPTRITVLLALAVLFTIPLSSSVLKTVPPVTSRTPLKVNVFLKNQFLRTIVSLRPKLLYLLLLLDSPLHGLGKLIHYKLKLLEMLLRITVMPVLLSL